MMHNSLSSTVFLVPIPIAEGALHTLSQEITTHTADLRHYFVENIRTARRFLRSIHPTLVIDDIQFSEIDKHKGPDTGLLRTWLKAKHNVGILSEAGCPGIADPGAELVGIAHSAGARIVPLTGPNSIILALMASGLNGQSFCFTGYLPVKEPDRSKRIKELEATSQKERQTQIFIETPYRNNQLISDLFKNLNDKTRLCIAQNISAPDAFIKTKTIGEWKKEKHEPGKVPAVFLILG